MKTFTNLEEMQPYYNANTDTYEFVENQKRFDVEFHFDLNIDRSINARNIYARDITAKDIDALNIKAGNIDAKDIDAENIYAANLTAGNIDALNIAADNIEACDIKFYAVCFAYKTFVCNSIKGRHKNSRYFCLDSD